MSLRDKCPFDYTSQIQYLLGTHHVSRFWVQRMETATGKLELTESLLRKLVYLVVGVKRKAPEDQELFTWKTHMSSKCFEGRLETTSSSMQCKDTVKKGMCSICVFVCFSRQGFFV